MRRAGTQTHGAGAGAATVAARASTGHEFGFATLFKDSMIYGAGRILQKFLALFLMPLYTSALTPREYGVLGMVLTTSTLIDILVTLGWDNAFSRFYFDDRAPAHRSQVITNTFYVSTAYPLLLLGVLAAGMPWISKAIMGQGGFAWYFDLALISIFFTNLGDIPMTLFRIDHRPWRFALVTLARVLIQIPLTVVLVLVLDMKVIGVLIGMVATSVIITAATLPTYWRRLRFRWDGPLFRAMFAFAVASLFAAIAFYVLNFSNRYLVRIFGDITQVGLYTSAWMLAQPVYFAQYAFRLAWPQWHYSWLHNPPKHKRLVARGYTYFYLLSCALLAVIATFLPALIRVLLQNEAYWTVGQAALVLCIATLFYGSYYLFVVGANVMKKNRLFPVMTAIAGGLTVGLNVLLLPRYGYVAAAYAALVGFALLAVLIRQLSQHYYPIPHEWLRIGKVSLATAVSIGAAYLIGWATGEQVGMPFGALMLRQAIKLPALALFPAILLATRFFTPSEATALRSAGRRLVRLVPALVSRRRAREGGRGGTVAPSGDSSLTPFETSEARSAHDGEQPLHVTEDELLAAEEREVLGAGEAGIRIDDRGGVTPT